MYGQKNVVLGSEDRTRLADIMEASLRVRNRHQFFQWTQGAVQGLLPHEILVCGATDGHDGDFAMHRFSITRDFGQEQFDVVCDPQMGLIPRAIAAWRRVGAPLMVAPDSAQRHPVLSVMVQANGMGNLAAHGVYGPGGRIASFFSFSRVSFEFGPQLAYTMELLTPVLHSALSRMLLEDSRPVADKPRRIRPITQREAEVLKWIKEGKTNVDIAQILNLSPWTVKNHMQAILKKLSVQNRSHAVARAISLGILSASD
ncbi:MAG TPA: XrtB/PEP-CTERM-associated transcriptional regulator EpsA [Burkholderiales bacterium]|nr:XrtB/PEP-CTERM-associated transcriptional regulator EpsA [Burkholderiales bacterium]